METKTLYFVQHGLALSKETDPERPLSDAGITQTTAIAQHLGRILPVSQIYHSDKLRARQTAEILATAVCVPPQNVKQHPHLSPNDDIQLLIPSLQDETLYVGHLPQLDKLCSYLLTGQEGTGIIQFQNSAIICLQRSNNHYSIQSYLTPALIVE